MPKVSIIIPIYNTEKYIKECINSCIEQTLQDIEIICINDGSTDNSSEIIKELAEKDERIVVLNQKNKGVSYSRNRGINLAKSKYIMFLDSDDFLEADACKIAYNKIKKDECDFVCFQVYMNEKRKKFFPTTMRTYDKYGSNKIEINCDYDCLLPTTTYSVNRIYRKDFLIKNNIFFDETLKFCEDTVFVLKTYIHAKSMSVCEQALYNYRRKTGLSVSDNFDLYIDSFFKSWEICLNLIRNSACHEKLMLEFFTVRMPSLFYWFSQTSLLKKKYFYNKMRELILTNNELKNFSTENNFFITDKLRRIKKYNFYEYVPERILNKFTNYKQNIFIKNILKKIYMSCVKIREYNCLRKSYLQVLSDLKKQAKNRKLNVLFLTHTDKWKYENVYNVFANDEKFNVSIIILKHSKITNISLKCETEQDLLNCFNYFKEKGTNVKMGYDFNTNSYVDIKQFNPDIIFYPDPWDEYTTELLTATSKYALNLYVPYFIANTSSDIEYNRPFHYKIWRYYVLNEKIKKFYAKRMLNHGKNLKVAGHPSLDGYYKYDLDNIQKEYIIYAPHWSINSSDTYLHYGTFQWNGEFILKFAKKHPEHKFVFKPHPHLFRQLILSGYMKEDEAKQYYEQWEKTGIKYEGTDYFELFTKAKLMLTDCGSFLTEFFPTKQPVIHLVSDTATKYNPNAAEIVKHYYNAKNLKELEKLLQTVLIDKNDYMKNQRISALKALDIMNGSSSERIVHDIKQELKMY